MKLFGSSWKTDLAGYLVMALGVVQQVLSEHPMPQNVHEWMVVVGYFVAGMGLKLAKDGDKSNAPDPEPVAQKVTNPDSAMGG